MNYNSGCCGDVSENVSTYSVNTLIVAERRRTAVEQSRERELQSGSVPIDHLPGYVQEDVAPFLIHVIQGTARHEEEIF